MLEAGEAGEPPPHLIAAQLSHPASGVARPPKGGPFLGSCVQERPSPGEPVPSREEWPQMTECGARFDAAPVTLTARIFREREAGGYGETHNVAGADAEADSPI